MTTLTTPELDPKLDLVLERVIDVPRHLVWNAWTTPEQVKQWWTPVPYQTIDCEIDLHPGGIFRTVSRSPEGEEYANVGCYLDLVEGERIVWTTAMGPGFRPGGGDAPFAFTAVISLTDEGRSTRYRAHVMHSDSASRDQHEEMGFHEGWGAVVDQLVEMIKADA
jgi:uncharacterized protein YndB with AHSA1/START domain